MDNVRAAEENFRTFPQRDPDLVGARDPAYREVAHHAGFALDAVGDAPPESFTRDGDGRAVTGGRRSGIILSPQNSSIASTTVGKTHPPQMMSRRPAFSLCCPGRVFVA